MSYSPFTLYVQLSRNGEVKIKLSNSDTKDDLYLPHLPYLLTTHDYYKLFQLQVSLDHDNEIIDHYQSAIEERTRDVVTYLLQNDIHISRIHSKIVYIKSPRLVSKQRGQSIPYFCLC